ncbi:uncharacterized protein [Hemitrygon akajei]|uniref:uncharacterized protein n=1 Tax=Hemitrygon akajei TaxID=2704970 RepID=UPI003BF98BF4
MSGGFTLDREQRDPWPLTPQTGALMARLKGPNWVDKLPWVLLGIRTAPKEDLRTSSAELVYGAPLVIPGEFIPAPRGQEEEPAAVLSRLRERLGNLAPIPTSQHGQNPTCVPKDLRNCKFVFVRQGGHRAPLQLPYEGPFTVIRNNGSTFVLDIGGREEVFSVDRLKPAHVVDWFILVHIKAELTIFINKGHIKFSLPMLFKF